METNSPTRQWDPATAAPTTISQLELSTAWTGSDMSAVARLFVEQQNAQSWWQRTYPHRSRVDVVDMLTGWLPYAYGVTPATPHRTEDGLSMAAQLVRDMLRERARMFADLPIYLAGPDVADTLIVLAGTHTYRAERAFGGVGIGGRGHLVLPTPLVRRRPAQADQVVDYVLQQDPVPDAVQAISWTVDASHPTRTQRVGDWILVGEVGDLDGSDIERQVAEAMRSSDVGEQMPELVWSSEWSGPITDSTFDTRLSAGDRMRRAVDDVRAGAVVPWARGEVYDDTDGLLAVRLVQVLSDAVAAGLLSAVPVAVAGTTREVFALSAMS